MLRLLLPREPIADLILYQAPLIEHTIFDARVKELHTLLRYADVRFHLFLEVPLIVCIFFSLP